MKRFGLVIVGDEILSGRRVDKHLAKVIELLTTRGLELSWAHYVGDDREAIAAVLRRTFGSGDVVFVHRRHRRDARRPDAAGGRRGARRRPSRCIPRRPS